MGQMLHLRPARRLVIVLVPLSACLSLAAILLLARRFVGRDDVLEGKSSLEADGRFPHHRPAMVPGAPSQRGDREVSSPLSEVGRPVRTAEAYRYEARQSVHQRISRCRLSRDETVAAVKALFGLSETSEILKRLRELYKSDHIDKQLTDQLLSYLDGHTEEEIRGAILQVLLYSKEEGYVVREVSRRYESRGISDAMYKIFVAFPAKLELLDFLGKRFSSKPVESKLAAQVLSTVFSDSGIRGTASAAPTTRVLESLVVNTTAEDIRGVLIQAYLRTGDPGTPEFVESWWARETSSHVRCRALQTLPSVGSQSYDWARSFLSRLVDAGAPEPELKAAYDSLSRMSPSRGR